MKQAAAHRERMIRFLREIVAIPSPTGQERRVVERIRREMLRAKCFDRVWTDPLGNLLARIGRGPRLIAIDAHVDTVGLGDPAEWRHDPYRGKVAGGLIYGRGAGDQKGAVPAMIYGMKILRDLKLLPPDCSVLLTCTVMEEDCDGLCWQYIVKEDRIRPECVVVTDSTNCRVLRGQRGRMEIGVTAKGRSCHGSMPEKGDNAVYKIARVIREIEQLNGRLKKNAFLGNGTITVSYVDCKTPSMCAVPGEAYIHLDRRLTVGETRAAALSQVRQALRRAGVRARVRVPRYSRPSYTGVVYETDHYFPTWCQPEDAPQVQAAVDTCRALFRQRQTPSRWTFSTNAVSIAGMFGIPCVGFGPAEEAVAHTVNDRVPVEHLVKCAAFYAGFPAVYCNGSPSS
jgi:putative selenium metabolism hydrolase